MSADPRQPISAEEIAGIQHDHVQRDPKCSTCRVLDALAAAEARAQAAENSLRYWESIRDEHQRLKERAEAGEAEVARLRDEQSRKPCHCWLCRDDEAGR